RVFTPRELSETGPGEEGEAGYLHTSAENLWPSETAELLERVPEDWLEERNGVLRLRPDRRKDLPRPVRVGRHGDERSDGLDCHFVAAPFRFCLHCGVAYGGRQFSDFTKLSSLSAGGRSTATTILSLSAIRSLKQEESLDEKARKLLSFTDNRQDASLQAGHFNDFVEFGLLRAALYRAAVNAGPEGLVHDDLTQRVFDALKLDKALYAVDPQVRFQAEQETNRAFRNVLGYRLYRDLKRGWRVTSPNLEQSGLVQIHYLSLDEVCEADDVWENRHPALAGATPDTRIEVARTLLDYMRRELAIKVDYLDRTFQERLQQQSSQRLTAPWALDPNETLGYASILLPRSSRPGESRDYTYLSPRSGFGQFLRRRSTFPDLAQRLSLDDTGKVIHDLLEALQTGGLVEQVTDGKGAPDPGYQVPASALRWVSGDGTRAFHDPIRVPNQPEQGGRTNRYFVEHYRANAEKTKGLEAREHTAQVPYDERVVREDRFRAGTLPVLFCSPTMELGVDIAELNVVNLRNVPPTPANYAQRSGRAGRSGQPAFVFAYCSTGSPHDQYFFKRPERMVSGAVSPPRIDLTNEDLVRAHVDAIWLTETKVSLGTSLKDILDLSGNQPSLPLQSWVRDQIESPWPRERARERAQRVLETMLAELGASRLVERRLARRGAADRHAALRPGLRSLAELVPGGAQPGGGAERDQHRCLALGGGQGAGSAAAAGSGGAARPAHRRAERRPIRLLLLPVLRERGVPARLQLPATPPVGVPAGPPRTEAIRGVRLAAAVLGHRRVRPAGVRLPRGLALPGQPRDSAGRRGRGAPDATGEAVLRMWLSAPDHRR
ncbi:MAG: hypothetical protein HY329_06185, partial [Chloroflexi bacterium]|nr:hypothetical protein [Chloroflexota bacterium]